MRARSSHKRPAIISLGWTLRDYAKRVWDNSSEDNVLFLAGGIAFNILLAAVPFFLLLIAGVTYLLPVLYRGQVEPSYAVSFFIDRLLPAHEEAPDSPIHKLVPTSCAPGRRSRSTARSASSGSRRGSLARCAPCSPTSSTSRRSAGSSRASCSTSSSRSWRRSSSSRARR